MKNLKNVFYLIFSFIIIYIFFNTLYSFSNEKYKSIEKSWNFKNRILISQIYNQDLDNQDLHNQDNEKSDNLKKQIYTNEKIYINDIIIKGNKFISSDIIKENLKIKPGDVVDIEDIKDNIRLLYDMGYFSDINVDFEQISNNKVNIIIVVIENPLVNKVEFKGNKILSSLDLIELINTRPGKILNYNIIRQDIEIINEEYNKRGYIGIPNHVEDLEITPDGKIIFFIKEAIYPTQIEIKGNTLFKEKDLMKLITIKLYEPLNKDELEKSLKNIYDFYQENGYLLADVKSNIEGNKIILEIYEAILEDIEVQGNTKTKKYVIEKHFNLEKGKVINIYKLRRGLRKLQLGGLFKNADIDFKGGSKPGNVIMIVKVEEQQTGQLVVGAGFGGLPGSNRGGIAGNISLSQLNYQGKGQQVFLNWERGNLVNSVSFSFSDPYSLKNDYFYSFSTYFTELFKQRAIVSNNPLTIGLYKDYRSSLSFSFGRRLISKDIVYSFSLGNSTFKVSPTPDQDYPYVINPSKGSYLFSGINLSKDTRDDEFYPAKGILYSFDTSAFFKNSGNLDSFSKFSFEVRKYFNLKNEKVFAIRFFIGLATDKIPFVYQYTLGGSDTLRGYDFNSFIGSKALLLNLEYRFPVSKKIENLYGAAFIDAGGAFQPNQSINLNKLGLDYGVGIRFVVPQFGSIRVDYAISNEKTKLAVGLGQMF
ncbi:MAG: BamA/OMP85 family outer membrane protein [bacterium]